MRGEWGPHNNDIRELNTDISVSSQQNKNPYDYLTSDLQQTEGQEDTLLPIDTSTSPPPLPATRGPSLTNPAPPVLRELPVAAAGLHVALMEEGGRPLQGGGGRGRRCRVDIVPPRHRRPPYEEPLTLLLLTRDELARRGGRRQVANVFAGVLRRRGHVRRPWRRRSLVMRAASHICELNLGYNQVMLFSIT